MDDPRAVAYLDALKDFLEGGWNSGGEFDRCRAAYDAWTKAGRPLALPRTDGPMVRWLTEQLGARLNRLRGPDTGWVIALGTRVQFQFRIYDTEMTIGPKFDGVVTAFENVDIVDREPRYRVSLDNGREVVARSCEVS